MTFDEIAARARQLIDPAPSHTIALMNEILVLIAELADAMEDK